jgi:prefoldin subunit 5
MSSGSAPPKRFLKGCRAKAILNLDSAFFVADRRLNALFDSRKDLETRMCKVETRMCKVEKQLKKARQKHKYKKEKKQTTKAAKKERR